MDREGNDHLCAIMAAGCRLAYHPTGYLYVPGEGVLELSCVQRKDEQGNYRYRFEAARAKEEDVPPGGWVALPTWFEAMRRAEP